ncbi:MAG TPA: succinate dehydrogenase/fumarate reductase iron-sulfur subunit [Desulfobacterales bacterium]
MNTRDIEFRIERYKPGQIDPPAWQHYRLSVDAEMTVLDCLELIRRDQEPTLMYRHSCHHSSCGTCGCMINGREGLACIRKVHDLNTAVVTLEPLRGFRRVGDLVVAFEEFYRDIATHWSGLRPSEGGGEPPANPEGRQRSRFEDCIECGCCVSVCPVSRKQKEFMGPAALAAANRERLKAPAMAAEILDQVGQNRGEPGCRRHLACSRVCPTGVYPARHIADLRKCRKNSPPR